MPVFKTLQDTKVYNFFKTPQNLQKVLAVGAIVAVGGIGSYFLTGSHAATGGVAFNVADGVTSGNAAIITDSTAKGGSAIRFGSTGSTTLAAFKQQASTIAMYLAPGVKPPTNQWFSNLAFQEPSNPVFAYPLAMQTMPSGFGLMYPKVVSTTNTVFGSYSHDLLMDMGAVNTRIASYDDLSVTMEALDSGGNRVATYRLTQGSPVVYVSLKAGKHITVTSPNAMTVTPHSSYDDLVVGSNTYLVSYNGAVSHTASGSTATLTANSDAQVAFGIEPAGITDVAGFVAEMQDPITSTTTGYGASTNTVSTQFTVHTQSDNGALMALLPAQQTGTVPGSLLGTYSTVMGTQKLYKFSNYIFTNPSSAPPTQLDVSSLTASEKSDVIAALTTDINNLPTKGFTAADTYFGGKQLARAANLMNLAKQLGQDALAQQAYNLIDAQMTQWLNPDSTGRSDHYFYYDTNLKGIVGVQPSFGSDTEFNDHHFHYGYFLYAAGLMSQYNPSFATAHAEIVNTLVRDIADSNRSDPYFPYLRPFDKYAGHSWASGTSPFADGNNNESSSEAVNAWYGLYLWGKNSHNSDLETLGRYLYGRESNSALTYWTNFDRSQPQFASYSHSVVSMVWGGKMDYGTWFSASSYAKLGIQVLPVTPASGYLGSDAARVSTNITNLNDGSAVMFPDIMAMYKSFSDPAGAVTDAKALSDSQIDDGDSRSWLLAWVYSH